MHAAETLTSVHNPRVREAVRLRDRRGRETGAPFLIDGVREIERAHAAGVGLLHVFVCPPLCAGRACQVLLGLLHDGGVQLIEVSEAVFSRLAFGERAEGVLAVAARPDLGLERLQLPPGGLVAIAEGIEKPGNLGALVRSADGAGVSALLLVGGRTDPLNPNAIRASLGTVFTLPIAEASATAAQAWLRERGYRVVAARPDATLDYTEADLTGAVAIAVGSEAAGLTDDWGGEDVTSVRLPMLGVADSLNVSVTGAVLFYEALRQRRARAND